MVQAGLKHHRPWARPQLLAAGTIARPVHKSSACSKAKAKRWCHASDMVIERECAP